MVVRYLFLVVLLGLFPRAYALDEKDPGIYLVVHCYRETWHTSLEMALQSLLQLRIAPSEAAIAIAKFRDHDLALLKRQRAIYTDESKLIQSAREASEELATLFEADRE